MPAAKTKPAVARRAAESAKAKTEDHSRVIEHVSRALETAQEDLASIGGTLSVGTRDLRKDVQRLLRDARRDIGKMSNALKGDLERVQKDLPKTTSKNGREAVKHGGARASVPPKAKSRTKAASR